MRNIPFTDLRSQYLESKNYIDNAIKEVIDTSSFLQGPIVDSFETAIKDYCGAESCASMGSGTVALLCALEAAGVGEGDEVITVSHTWVSTTETICNVGAVPVFVDIDDFYHIDVAGIEHRITDKTKAIVFVDMYGQTTNVDSLKAIANTHNLILIEDAAQSFGSSYNSLISPDVYKTYQVGSIADLTCFSFNPVKNLGAMGDAGAVLLGGFWLMWLTHNKDNSVFLEWKWSAFIVLLAWCIGQNILVEMFLYHDQLAEGKPLSWAPLSPLGPYFNPILFEFNNRTIMLQSQMPWLILPWFFYMTLINLNKSS
mgnify:CR=1 FL=1